MDPIARRSARIQYRTVTGPSRGSIQPTASHRVDHMPIVGRCNGVATEATKKASVKRNGNAAKEHPKSPELGRELRKISDAYVASGGKLLNRRELEREIAERRASR